MTVAAKPIALTSPGPVAEAFMRSRAFIVVIIGPVGSGKTMAMLQKGVRNGAMQGARIDVLAPVHGHRAGGGRQGGGDCQACAALGGRWLL